MISCLTYTSWYKCFVRTTCFSNSVSESWWSALVPGATAYHILIWVPLENVKQCTLVLGSSTLDPLVVMSGVTVKLGKVTTNSRSATRAHVEGSADGYWCWKCQICMLLLWVEDCSSIRLATEASSPWQKCCSSVREIIMRWIWIESVFPLDLLPRQGSTAWCPPVWKGKVISPHSLGSA